MTLNSSNYLKLVFLEKWRALNCLVSVSLTQHWLWVQHLVTLHFIVKLDHGIRKAFSFGLVIVLYFNIAVISWCEFRQIALIIRIFELHWWNCVLKLAVEASTWVGWGGVQSWAFTFGSPGLNHSGLHLIHQVALLYISDLRAIAPPLQNFLPIIRPIRCCLVL